MSQWLLDRSGRLLVMIGTRVAALLAHPEAAAVALPLCRRACRVAQLQVLAPNQGTQNSGLR